jgi:hypothetical protein
VTDLNRYELALTHPSADGDVELLARLGAREILPGGLLLQTILAVDR